MIFQKHSVLFRYKSQISFLFCKPTGEMKRGQYPSVLEPTVRSLPEGLGIDSLSPGHGTQADKKPHAKRASPTKESRNLPHPDISLTPGTASFLVQLHC